MSYDSVERSISSAVPIALYDFTLGEKTWRYAASEDQIEVMIAGLTIKYDPLVIKDEGFSESGSPDNEDVKVSLPRTTPIAQLFRAVAPSDEVYITIRRTNFGTMEAPVYWIGTIKSTKAIGLNELELTCMMMASSFNRQGLRLGWQKGCNNSLYDQNCTVNPNDWVANLTISALSDVSVFSDQILAFPQGYFNYGYVEWDTEFGTKERRAIDQQVGPSIQLLEGSSGLSPGRTIRAYRGCSLTTTSCKSFNNLPNYGGCPHMPGKNPFDGNPVF